MPHEVASGVFLIASPTLRDPNFSRTVVLLCEHDPEEGSMGLVVNRPSEYTLEQTLNAIGPHPTQPLYVGGPVQRDIVLVLHRDAQITGARTIVDGLGLGGEEEEIVALVRGPGPAKVHVFSGYSGWGAGQLEAELENHSWIVCPAHAKFVFEVDPAVMWAEVLRSLGPRYAYLADVPLDPNVN